MNEKPDLNPKQSTGPATPEQIQELPHRYAIGKRPLSRLLGWGELTYTRLLDGGVPNAAHSDEIRRLLDDPAAYARLLEIGREHKVITDVAYEKSRRAVDALLAEGGHDEMEDPLKIFAVADRICALTDGDITPRTLQMLMHVAQERATAQGVALFEQKAVAVEWGYEYPQIAAGYSFEAIQAVAARLHRLTAVEAGAGADAGAGAETGLDAEPEPATESAAESEFEPEPESTSSKKKGKKDKKGKKGKDKEKKKGKKAKKAAVEIAAEPEAEVGLPTESATAKQPEPDRKSLTAPKGPLALEECRLVDEVVARYQSSLKAAFA